MKNPPIKNNKQYVVLDTCIIQYFGDSELANCILTDLKEAVKAGYDLAISDFTFFELLDGASVEKETQRIDALNGLSRAYVKRNTLIAAAHLGCLYADDKASADIGDKIIGATALLSNSIIYTANVRDYPLPFYNVLLKGYLIHHKKGFEVTIPSYFLKPDVDYIIKKYNERTKPLEKTIEVLPTPSLPPEVNKTKY